MPKTEKHVHKLKKLRYNSGNVIFFCTLPDCNYKAKVGLLLGKRTICWRCGENFLLNEYSLRLTYPHCENCHHGRESKAFIGKEDSVTVVDEISDRLSAEQEETLAQRLERQLKESIQEKEDDI